MTVGRVIPGPEATTIQQAYDRSPVLITGAGGPLAMSRVLADSVSVLTLDKSPVSSAAGSALAVNMGSFATGPGIDITHLGSGPELQWGTNKIQGSSVYLAEKAAGLGNVAGLGQFFVKDGTPNTAWFQDDTGTDFRLGVGGLTALSVANIADPSAELNAIDGLSKGETRLCYQTSGNSDIWTLYVWDDADASGEAVPYRVDGATPTGTWSAFGGRYNWNGIDTPGEMVLFAGSAKAVMVGESVLQNTSTGVFRFDGLSIGAPTTDIDIGAGAGHVLNIHTDPDAPTHTDVSWSATSLTISDLSDGTITWVYMDPAGVPQQQATPPTPIQLRENLHLGLVVTFTGAILAFVSAPYVFTNPAMQLSELFDAIGTINLSVAISNGGSGLTLANSGGTLVARGANFDGTAAGRADPNSVAVSSANPQSFRYGTQTTFNPTLVTDIDPANYDVAGTITPIPGSSSRATNQRIWIAPDGQWGVQYGTVWYGSITLAISGSSTEAFVDNPTIAQNNSVLVATLSVIKGATDLSDPTHARFLPGSKFGEAAVGGSGQSVTDVQQAYNNSLDGTITLDATRDAFKLVQPVLTSGSPEILRLTGGAHTTLAASTEASDVVIDSGRIVQFATGALPTQRTVQILPATYAFAAASVITDGDTLYLGGPPVAGTNATIDNPSALRIGGDNTGVGEEVALRMANTTPATAGAQKHSPMAVLEGRGWETDVGSSQMVKFAQQVVPVQGAANPSGELVFKASIENVSAGAYADVAALVWDGVSGQLVSPDGLVGSPGVAFDGSRSSGIFYSGSGVQFSFAGVKQLTLSASRALFSQGGSEAAPGIQLSDGSVSGLFRPAFSELGISTGNTEAVRWDASQNQINAGNLLGINGAQATPTYSYSADPDTGDYLAAVGDLRTVVGNALYIRYQGNQIKPSKPIVNISGTAGFPGCAIGVTNVGFFGLGGTQIGLTTLGVERQLWTANTTGLPVSTITRLGVLGVEPSANLDVVGLALVNTDAALTGAPENSPALLWQGEVYDGTVTQTARWSAQIVDGIGTEDSFQSSWALRTQNSIGWQDVLEATRGGTDNWIKSYVDIEPSADSTLDLGSTSLYWDQAYAVKYNLKTKQDYTLQATAVLDRSLLPSASATTTNNNNLIAAMITDLIAAGFYQ